ncbi:hypothetical protein L484_014842 [Morus notabilis]|uniref:Mediator-associated protein 1 n=1 Tax=Morus notabilis TaxID=981085 RepID=W9QER5_9ROSA|nr:probable transcription factor At1g11510 [Morus notabilis]EXB31415.1 hypothetical protein L484_014842 [Morus notabilis]
MAPKRAPHLDDPPTVSSSSDEEEASSEEASGSEDDEQEVSDSNVKPKEETPPKAKKPRSKPSAMPSRQSVKRTKKSDSNAENGGSEEEEEAKMSGGDDSKKLLFQRLWSEDDEIAILKGMIDYAAKTGADAAVADMNAFYDFIKKSLHIDATKTQLSDKVRRLKKKYVNNLKKKYNPTKPHELEAFQLSKKIWGSREPKSNGTAKSNQKGKSELLLSPAAPAEIETTAIDRKAGPSASLSELIRFDKSLPEHVVKQGLDLISESKKAELEAKWRMLHIAEFELFVKKSQLISEQSKLILEAIKPSDD